MPVRRFFSLLHEGRRLAAVERVVECDVQAIAICNAEYYGDTRDRFVQEVRRLTDGDDVQREGPTEIEAPPIADAGSSLDQLSAILTMKRRSMGLGGR